MALKPQQVGILRVVLLPVALLVGPFVAFTGGSSIAAFPFVTPGATRAVLREYSLGGLERTLSVNNVKTVTRLVGDLNALPLFPTDTIFNCPNDDGHLYRLTFYYPARETESVHVQVSGCRIVQRKGVPSRWLLAAKSQNLLTLLEHIVDTTYG